MSKITYSIIGIIITLCGLFGITAAMPPATAHAANAYTFDLLPPWYKDLNTGPNGGIIGPDKYTGGLGGWLTKIALNLIEDMLYITGYVSLGFVIWGGMKFILHGDNSSGVADARKTIQNAVIGLIISIFAVAIVTAISGAFTR